MRLIRAVQMYVWTPRNNVMSPETTIIVCGEHDIEIPNEVWETLERADRMIQSEPEDHYDD